MAEAWTESADKSEAIVTGRVRMRVGMKKWYPLLIILAFVIVHILGYLSWWWLILEIFLVIFCPFLWWMQNDEEPMAGPEYLVGYPDWLRVAGWYARNPLQNFGKYVAGVYDRNYTVTGTPPVMWITAWNDEAGWTFETGRRGWKWSVIRLKYMRLPFVSYVGKKWMWYLGWSWWGFFGAKLNKLNSSFQVV